MKILVCMSSYRKNGNTGQVVQLLGECLQKAAGQHNETIEIETLYLGHMDIRPCRGCRVCFDRGESCCPLKDDVPAIKARMKAADGIVLASPVYVDDVNGIMKNLLDRLAHLCHRPEFGGKCVYLLATTGSTPANHALRTLNAPMYWGCSIIGRAGFRAGALMKRDEIARLYHRALERAAACIVDAIYKQKYASPSFYSLMVFRIQQEGWRKKADHDSIDYLYWNAQGWLDRRREFYFEHEAGIVTTTFARLAGAIIGRFIT
jgi:multimeric flavodoxin WrbA